MAGISWEKVGRTIADAAPALGGVLGGPAGAAAGSLIAATLGTSSDPDAVMEKLRTDPEALLKIRQIEADEREKIRDWQLATVQAYLADTQNARAAHAGNAGVFKLGVVILVTFAAVMAAALWGAYGALTGGITIKDPATVAAVSTFIGTLVGYAASNAQQVIGFFYGSSKGSSDKTDAMAAAIGQLSGPRK